MKPMSYEIATSELALVVVIFSEVEVQLDCPVKCVAPKP